MKLNFGSTNVVDEAMDALSKILEGRGELRFHQLLKYFDFGNDPQEHILACQILTKALYKLRQEGKIRKRITFSGEYYGFVYPDEESTYVRVCIIGATLIALLFIMKAMG